MRVLMLVHSYPSAPQTFTQAEIRVWRAEGLDVRTLAFRRPPPDRRRLRLAEDGEEEARTTYLGDVGLRTWMRGIRVFVTRPLRAVRTLLKVLTASYCRETTIPLRIHSALTWFRAIGTAGVLKGGVYDELHAEFANDTATVAWILHYVTGLPFSIRDHFSYNPQLLKEKVCSASVTLACCDANRRWLLEQAGVGSSDRVLTSYLGVNLDEWRVVTGEGDGIVCVGTLQEKKGQLELLRACAQLRERGVVVKCCLVGDGPLRGVLQREIAQLRLATQVTITGYVPPHEARRLMEGASVVCLPSVVAATGDSDGIPVALMEAMALGRACVSTDAGGIAELITTGVDGILVPQRDVTALADALDRVLADRALRERLGTAARQTIEQRFRLDVNAKRSAALVVGAVGRIATEPSV